LKIRLVAPKVRQLFFLSTLNTKHKGLYALFRVLLRSVISASVYYMTLGGGR